MNIVVENNIGLDKDFSPERIAYHAGGEFRREKSCFYDFGAESSVEFSGFIEERYSEFIHSVEKMFQ